MPDSPYVEQNMKAVTLSVKKAAWIANKIYEGKIKFKRSAPFIVRYKII